MNYAKRITMVISFLPVLAGLLLLTGGLAQADTGGYQVANTLGLGVHIRSGPSQQASVIGGLPEGAAIAIACQITGSDVNGSTIWDRLTSGGYLSDYYTDTPAVGTFSPGLTRCPNTPAPAAGVDSTRANQAIGW